MTVELVETSGEEYAENIAAAEKICFSEPWSLQAVKDFLSYSYNGAAAALVNGEFAGYITYTDICGEMQIANVATLPEFRRMGVASLLLIRILKIAENNNDSTVSLEVRASNAGAIALYAGFGFKKAGERKGFYKNPPDDAVLMNYTFSR